MKKIIGISMLVVFFAPLFIFVGMTEGWANLGIGILVIFLSLSSVGAVIWWCITALHLIGSEDSD